MSVQISGSIIPAINEDVISEQDFEGSSDNGLRTLLIAQNERLTTKKVGTGWVPSVFLVVNAALGAGLLNFPDAYNRAGGLVVASIVQAVLLFFIIIALLILANCSDLNYSKTYQDVVYSLCGKRAHQICSIGIILYCYGTCITFLIIIGDQFDRLFASLHGSDFCHHWYYNRNFTISLTSVIFILPLCFPKKIDFLKYASSLGVLAIVYVTFLILYQFFTESYPKGVIRTRPDKWTDVFNVVPVICFGYQCHVSVVPIYSCLQERNVHTFSKTVITAIGICIVMYTLSGCFGYLTFGSKVPSDILEGYNATKPIVIVGILALVFKTVTTYPILQFCGRAAADSILMETNCFAQSYFGHREKIRRGILALIWFTSTIAISIIVPNIGSVIQILGSLAAIFIFAFPGWCWIEATFYKDPHLYLLKDRLIILVSCCFIVVGLFIFGVVLTQAIQNISTNTHMSSLCTE